MHIPISVTFQDDLHARLTPNLLQGSHGRQQSAQSDDEYDEEEGPNGPHRARDGRAVPVAAQMGNATEKAPDWIQMGFRPACDIVEKDALSAIRRAPTLSCKRELANITCLAQGGALYPSRLPRSCDNPSGRCYSIE